MAEISVLVLSVSCFCIQIVNRFTRLPICLSVSGQLCRLQGVSNRHHPTAKRLSDVKTKTRLGQLRLHSLYFPQNTLMLNESRGKFSDLHSIFGLRSLRYWVGSKSDAMRELIQAFCGKHEIMLWPFVVKFKRSWPREESNPRRRNTKRDSYLPGHRRHSAEASIFFGLKSKH